MSFIVKSSPYYFQMKAKILADFQICINAPLSAIKRNGRTKWAKFACWLKLTPAREWFFYEDIALYQINFFFLNLNQEAIFHSWNIYTNVFLMSQYGGPEVQHFSTNHNFFLQVTTFLQIATIFYKPQLFSTILQLFCTNCSYSLQITEKVIFCKLQVFF